jgi:hypothetical protein
MKNKRTNNKTKITSASLLFSLKKMHTLFSITQSKRLQKRVNNMINKIKDTRQILNNSFSETLTFYKKLDDIMLELYDDHRSMYESLKVFFERLMNESSPFELDQHLHMQEEDLIKELRKQFETLRSKSESSNQ